MLDRLMIIAGIAAIMLPVYALAMGSTPRRGYMLLIERLCAGVILCFLLNLMLSPFGLAAAQSPLAALSAGLWGLPGAALSTFVALWP